MSSFSAKDDEQDVPNVTNVKPGRAPAALPAFIQPISQRNGIEIRLRLQCGVPQGGNQRQKRALFRRCAQGRPAYELIVRAFGEAGIDGVSVLHGIMGFDLASGMLSARPPRFHPDLPVAVEAVGSREDIERALSRIKEVLNRGLITLAEVELYVPER